MHPSAAAFSFLFADDTPPRPVSLGSLAAMEMMRVPIAEASPADLQMEADQIAAFHWLHTADLREVQRALWQGTWRSIIIGAPVSEPIIAMFRVERSRFLDHVRAATVRVRRKPAMRSDDTPADVVRPSLHEHRILKICSAYHLAREQVEWHVPLVEALHMYHCAQWSEGCWTVAGDTPEAVPADFEGFDLPGIDTVPEA